MDDVGPGIRSS